MEAWKLRKETKDCTTCLETNATRVEICTDNDRDYLQQVIHQQEDSFEICQANLTNSNKIIRKQKQLISIMKVSRKEKGKEMNAKYETLVAQTKETLTAVPASSSPVLYIGIALLLVAVIIGIVVLWMKIRSFVDSKINPLIDSRLTAWISEHQIGEIGSYMDGDFTINITKKDEVKHGVGRTPKDT